MADFAAAEIAATGGYARQQISYSADGTWNVGNARAEMGAQIINFTASGASFADFNTIWVAIGANGTRGNTTGIARFYTTTSITNGVASIVLTDGQTFRFTYNAYSSEVIV